MGIEAPIPISSKMGDTNSVFLRIVQAAERPHLNIPETEAGRSRKQYHRLINRSLMFVSGILISGLLASLGRINAYENRKFFEVNGSLFVVATGFCDYSLDHLFLFHGYGLYICTSEVTIGTLPLG